MAQLLLKGVKAVWADPGIAIHSINRVEGCDIMVISRNSSAGM
jgi:hypothetical protein